MGISREQALDCFASDDLIGIGMEADAVRRRLHPDGVVSYLLDGKIDCAAGDLEAICAKIDETLELGGTGVVLEGGVGSGIGLADWESLLEGIGRRCPGVWLHGLSASEIVASAAGAGLTIRETLLRLRAAGLDSIPGNDAGILDDALRSGCSVAEWLAVHRTAHELGIGTTAAMVFGSGETMEQRIRHLELLRQLQEETGGFTAFVPSSFRPQSRQPGWEEATAVEYLKTMAIARMVLDNIENMQADWTAQGLKVLQMGLRFGSNDVGSVQLKAKPATTEEELRRVIRDAGFRPVQRDTVYRTMFLN
jgi:cyclic dehypoxanthinyl futalosine synthase